MAEVRYPPRIVHLRTMGPFAEENSIHTGVLGTAQATGEMLPHTDAEALGDLCAIILHGSSVQARDGISRERLLVTIPLFLASLNRSIE